MSKKKSAAKSLLPQFIAVIALSISVFLIIDLGRRAAANYRVQREAERLTQEVAVAQAEQDALLARRSYVSSDLYVEEMARQELKWARPGETVIVVMATPEAILQPANTETPTVSSYAAPQTPAQAWWNLFFGAAPY